MSSLPWASHFGLSESDLTSLNDAQNPNGHDPLRAALLSGKINQADYLRWAMEKYELPSLKASFFDVPHDLIFWEAVRTKSTWNPSFYPLAEWQGVLYIGCLEYPTFHFVCRDPHRFVLVAAASLAKRFQEFEPNYKATIGTHVAQAAPVAVAEAVAHIADDVSSDEVSDFASEETVTDAVASTSAPAAAAPVVVAQAPEVRQRPLDEYLADSLPPAPDVSLEDPDGILVKIPPASTPNLFVVPDGMTVDDIGAPLSTAPDGLENAGTSVLDFSSLGSDSETAAEAPAVAAPVAVAAPAIPPRPPVSAAEPAVSLAQRPYVEPVAAEGVSAKTPPPPAPIPLASQAKVSTVSQAQPAAALETCASEDALGAATIGHILKSFDQALVFMYKNGELRPWKWSEQLLAVKGDKPDAIPLEPASIFRIAQRTCLPYHGYVVANPTNTAFFNAFTRGIVPKHVTLVPVMTSGKISGMIMGISDQRVDYKSSLIAMEKLASECGTQLGRLRVSKAA